MKSKPDTIRLIAKAYANRIQYKVPDCTASQIEEALYKAITKARYGGYFSPHSVAGQMHIQELRVMDDIVYQLAIVRDSWPAALEAMQSYELETGAHKFPSMGDLIRFDCTVNGSLMKDVVGRVYGNGASYGIFLVSTPDVPTALSIYVGDIKEIITESYQKGYVWVDVLHKGSVIPLKGNQYLSAAKYRVDSPTWVHVPARRGCLEHVYTTVEAASKAFRVGSRNPEGHLKNCLLYKCDFVLATVAQEKAYKKDYGKDMLKTGCAYAQAVRLDHVVSYCEPRAGTPSSKKE